MKANNIILCVIALLCCGQSINAQLRIHGRVLDAEQNPVAGVNCLLVL